MYIYVCICVYTCMYTHMYLIFKEFFFFNLLEEQQLTRHNQNSWIVCREPPSGVPSVVQLLVLNKCLASLR